MDCVYIFQISYYGMFGGISKTLVEAKTFSEAIEAAKKIAEKDHTNFSMMADDYFEHQLERIQRLGQAPKKEDI